jgi:excisionase family DNA binding protein
MDFSNLLTIAEAQRLTTLSKPTVRGKTRGGEIRVVRIGGSVFIFREHLEEYLQQHREHRYPASK